MHEVPRVESFVERWPEFAPGGQVDQLRTREFGRLDTEGHVYLDYTGAGLAAASQIRRHADLLLDRVLGNPHSESPTSRLATDFVDRARHHVFSFFGASPEEYVVIFTANASHALKLVGESYPFGPGHRFVLTFDNHNSVNGIREYARAAGAEVVYLPVVPPDLRVDASTVTAALDPGGRLEPGLFAFPAQSNFSGVQHDLSWIEAACWTRPRSCRPTVWISRAGILTSSCCRSTRCSAIRPVSAR
jgi:molybdenum cofactor sulfurtransferase